jgi:hypothetical protein
MPQDWARSLLSAIARCSHDRCGASAMVVAIALPGLIGFGALGAETGLWYTIKLWNQSSADAAAISAAYEVIDGKTSITSRLTAASEAAMQNGYTGTTPAVVYPYTDSVVGNGVAVTLQQTQGALLASLSLPGVTVTSKSVAVTKVLNNPCILALAADGTGVEVVSSSSLNAPNCSVAANSTSKSAIELQDGTSSIAAATLVTEGEISVAGNPIDPAAPPSEFILSSRPMIGAPAINDPYASTLTHAFLTSNIPATRVNRGIWNGPTPTTLTPALYAKGMSFGPNAVIDLTPGVYYVANDDFSVASGATVSGAGVTIILATTDATGGIVGNVQISSGAMVSLQAPNSGTFSGLLFVQDSASAIGAGVTYTSGGSFFQGGPSMVLTGLLYLPNTTTVGFQGNPLAGSCTLLVTNQVVIDGNFSFTSSGCSSAGLTTLPTVNTVVLAE